jgi:hypothetical protein
MEKSDVLITVNRSYKNQISDEVLANTILSMKEPTDERIFVLFTEVSAKRLLKWAYKNNISEDTLKSYYEKYIKPRGLKNRELEQVFYEI